MTYVGLDLAWALVCQREPLLSEWGGVAPQGVVIHAESELAVLDFAPHHPCNVFSSVALGLTNTPVKGLLDRQNMASPSNKRLP